LEALVSTSDPPLASPTLQSTWLVMVAAESGPAEQSRSTKLAVWTRDMKNLLMQQGRKSNDERLPRNVAPRNSRPFGVGAT
jgi:hypothetical protein